MFWKDPFNVACSVASSIRYKAALTPGRRFRKGLKGSATMLATFIVHPTGTYKPMTFSRASLKIPTLLNPWCYSIGPAPFILSSYLTPNKPSGTSRIQMLQPLPSSSWLESLPGHIFLSSQCPHIASSQDRDGCNEVMATSKSAS